jgi:TolA-binding protein
MKKNSWIIVVSLLVMFLCGCSANDHYIIEKKFYRIKKETNRIYNNPFASPPKELERVVELLKNFVQVYPNNNLTIKAEFEIAQLYAVKEEFDKAREQLTAIINKYADNRSIVTEAIFLTGQTYQAQENWNQALEQYKKIIRQYPATVAGLRMPIYIANYYKFKHQPEKMISAYQDAAKHYKSLNSSTNNPLLKYITSGLLARSYVSLKEWENALATYDAMLSEYTGKVNMDTILMEMALIYSRELKRKDKTKEVLAQLLKQYPKSRFAKAAQKILKEMSKNER